MTWRTVVISHSAKLDFHFGYMVVRMEKTTRIHLDEIYEVLIESTAVSLTAALISELCKRKVPVIFCDEKRNPIATTVNYYGSYESSDRIREQITWKNEAKTAVWTAIVSEKIGKQAEILAKYSYISEAEQLNQYVREIVPGDSSNREGHAAKVYFNRLFGPGFSRDAESSVNAALNYGYTIILSAFNREITAAGYLTQLGIFHDNGFNPFNLSSDLMEPFRPLVDDLVEEMKPTKFGHEEKVMMLNILQRSLKIRGKKEIVANAIKTYCHSVFDALTECDVSKLLFYSLC